MGGVFHSTTPYPETTLRKQSFPSQFAQSYTQPRVDQSALLWHLLSCCAAAIFNKLMPCGGRTLTMLRNRFTASFIPWLILLSSDARVALQPDSPDLRPILLEMTETTFGTFRNTVSIRHQKSTSWGSTSKLMFFLSSKGCTGTGHIEVGSMNTRICRQ